MAFAVKTQNVLVEDLNNGRLRVTANNAPAVVHTRVYSNTTRPSAALFPAGFQIWNTDDNAPNFSDGTNWRDAVGILT